jgi:flagellar protein FlaI
MSSENFKILEEYEVSSVRVRILERNGLGYYEIIEPKLRPEEEKILKDVLEKIYYSDKENIEDEFFEELKVKGVEDDILEKLGYYLKKNLNYGEITPLILDPFVEEIECRGFGYPITIIHRNYPQYPRMLTNIIPKNEEDVIKIIEKLANRANKPVSIARPMLEFSLPEGHRVAATVSNEISLPGSTFDIRKFPTTPIDIIDLIKRNMLNEIIASYLWLLLDYKPFLMILGPTGSGKTTLLNAILSLVNPLSKIVTIEDTAELNLSSHNWVRFISRSLVNQEYEVSIWDLAKLALRYRPDYLVIGEVRGKEIEALIHASATGHGSLTTFHGGRPEDAVTRVMSLVNEELAKIFLQNIWGFIIVGLKDVNGEKRKSVISIYEVIPSIKNIKFKKIIKWSFEKKTFLPESVEELVERSYRLKWIMKVWELDKDKIVEELNLRKEFLMKIFNENKINIFYELIKFYMRRNNNEILQTI